MADRKWKQKYDQRRNHLLERPQEAATAAGREHFVGVKHIVSECHTPGFQSLLGCALAVQSGAGHLTPVTQISSCTLTSQSDNSGTVLSTVPGPRGCNQ